MNISIAWEARVTGANAVETLTEWANDIERGLKNAEMVPADARITSVNEWMDRPSVVIAWKSQQEMADDDEQISAANG